MIDMKAIKKRDENQDDVYAVVDRSALLAERLQYLPRPSLIDEYASMEAVLKDGNQVAALKAENQQLRAAVSGSLVAGAKRELSGEFPGLSDPEQFDRVTSLAGALAQTGEYPDPLDAMRKAAQVTFATQVAERAAQERSTSLSQRDQGQPEVPQPSDSPTMDVTKPMTPEQRDEYSLSLLMNGKTKAQVVEAMAKLPY